MSPEEENSKWYIFFEFSSTVNFAKKKFQFSDNLYWSLFLTTKFWWLTRSIVDHWAVTLMGDCSSTSKLVSRKNFFPLSLFFQVVDICTFFPRQNTLWWWCVSRVGFGDMTSAKVKQMKFFTCLIWEKNLSRSIVFRLLKYYFGFEHYLLRPIHWIPYSYLHS